MIELVHKKEITMIDFLNTFYDWNLKHTGYDHEHYDASGYTKKNNTCIMEMKFRNNHYEDMMIEKKKFDWLMENETVDYKFYLVQDPTGLYIFCLNYLDFKTLPIKKRKCPKKTFWKDQGMTKKEVYLLPKKMSHIKILNK